MLIVVDVIVVGIGVNVNVVVVVGVGVAVGDVVGPIVGLLISFRTHANGFHRCSLIGYLVDVLVGVVVVVRRLVRLVKSFLHRLTASKEADSSDTSSTSLLESKSASNEMSNCSYHFY